MVLSLLRRIPPPPPPPSVAWYFSGICLTGCKQQRYTSIFEQGLANIDIPVLLPCRQFQGETPTSPAANLVREIIVLCKIPIKSTGAFLSITHSSGLKINKAEPPLHCMLIMRKQKPEQGVGPPCLPTKWLSGLVVSSTGLGWWWLWDSFAATIDFKPMSLKITVPSARWQSFSWYLWHL